MQRNDATEWMEHVFLQVAKQKGSDLHLSGVRPLFMRKFGELEPLTKDAIGQEFFDHFLRSVLSETEWETFQQKGEVDKAYTIDGQRFRLNVYLQQGKPMAAARVIPSIVPTLDRLSLPPILKTIAKRHQGLVLVTGATGSGKSSTLAAIVDYINETMRKHIITLEQPVEYLHSQKQSLIDQRDITVDTESFTSGLRSAMRQDPDVILIGEMRDLETISTAITAAETGHLVLGTLHTRDAPSTIERMIDVFPASQQGQIRLQLAQSLVAVVSQQLLPLADGTGRVAALELLCNNSAVQNLIRQEKTFQLKSVMETSKQEGMMTMNDSLRQLVQEDKVDRDVAYAFGWKNE